VLAGSNRTLATQSYGAGHARAQRNSPLSPLITPCRVAVKSDVVSAALNDFSRFFPGSWLFRSSEIDNEAQLGVQDSYWGGGREIVSASVPLARDWLNLDTRDEKCVSRLINVLKGVHAHSYIFFR